MMLHLRGLLIYLATIHPLLAAECDIKSSGTVIICDRVTDLNLPFLGIPNLNQKITHDIEFINSCVHNLTSNIFSDLPNIHMLNLTQSCIRNLEIETFRGLFNLYRLILSNNNLTIIRTELFKDLDNLNKLDLSFNQITTIEKGAFKYLRSIENIYLSKNLIHTLSSDLFDKCSSLREVHMDSNRIVEVNSILSNNKKLVVLRLDDNKIETFGLNLTKHTKLTTLMLGNNYLTYFDARFLPEEIIHLNIDDNELMEVTGLNVLNQLYSLSLSKNNLTNLTMETFKGLVKLNRLSLDYNYISELKPGLFSYLNYLTQLDLSHNEVDRIDFGTFGGLINLATLDLSYNKLEKLEENAFYSLLNLVTLKVSFNSLEYVYLKDLVEHCPKLRVVDINGNNIKCSVLSGLFRFAQRRDFDLGKDLANNMSTTNIHGIPCVSETTAAVDPDDMEFSRLMRMLNSTLSVFNASLFKFDLKQVDPSEIDNELATNNLVLILIFCSLLLVMCVYVFKIFRLRCPRRSLAVTESRMNLHTSDFL